MGKDHGHGSDPVSGLPARIASLLELLASLDQRVVRSMDSIEEMRRSLAELQRQQAQLDEVREALVAKIKEIDVDSVTARFERLEQAIFNIETATTQLEKTMTASVDALPDSISRRIRSEAAESRYDPPQA